jgi:hypothetical protein
MPTFTNPVSPDASQSPIRELTRIDSFMIVARYPVNLPLWNVRFGVHHAFTPTGSEVEEFANSRTLVDDILVAVSPDRFPPEIQLFNPRHARPGTPPRMIKSLRPVPATSDTDDDDEPVNPAPPSAVDETFPDDADADMVNLYQSRHEPYDRGLDPPNHPSHKSQNPWSLKAKGWKASFSHIPAIKAGILNKPFIRSCAISPRGARWVAGAADVNGIFIFRLKE